MKIIAVAAAKGGVGKTSITAALAVAASRDPVRPLNVAVMDLDPQGSLSEWWNRRACQDAPGLVHRGRHSLDHIVQTLRSGEVDLLILDCPPSYSPLHREAIGLADLVVIPTGPGALDLEAIEKTIDMADQAGTVYCAVLNGAIFRSRVAGRAIREMQERNITLGPVLHHRVAVAEASRTGQTALEIQPTGAAAREIRAAWQHVQAELGQSPPRAHLDHPTRAPYMGMWRAGY
jgi:chromosome partitioning protein